MSVNGEYLRVTPAELDRALKDPEWAWDLAEEVQDAQAEGEPAPAEARHFTTHQTWHLLGFLLQRTAFPVDVVHGEEPLATDDWGYGPPQYLTPERVQLAADTLHRTTYDQLIQGVDPSELTKAEPPDLGLACLTGVGRRPLPSPDRVLPGRRIRRSRDADLDRLIRPACKSSGTSRSASCSTRSSPRSPARRPCHHLVQEAPGGRT
ncbi:YfbM family protein [Streptomyces sp. NPDC059979]|uniref:YfbM family protein n=1 Tax=Streptomyces sp. NPDC059979 TaxID=3347021 RepID=UPI0036A26C45